MPAMPYITRHRLVPAESRRHWQRLALPILFAITVLCVSLGTICNRATRQRNAVKIIEKAGGKVWYDYQVAEEGPFGGAAGPATAPTWLRNWIGVDYCATAIGVVLTDEDGVSKNVFRAIGDLPHLRTVSLSGMAVTDSTLLNLRDLGDLRELTISDSSVSDAGWKPLEQLTRLEFLTLDGSNVDDAALSHIKGLTHLKDLKLFTTGGVTDAGLSDLQRLSRLMHLTLYSSDKITDAGMQYIKRLPRLTLLDIAMTGVSEAGVRDLKEDLPTLRIIRR
jgi:hypothetical protein